MLLTNHGLDSFYAFLFIVYHYVFFTIIVFVAFAKNTTIS